MRGFFFGPISLTLPWQHPVVVSVGQSKQYGITQKRHPGAAGDAMAKPYPQFPSAYNIHHTYHLREYSILNEDVAMVSLQGCISLSPNKRRNRPRVTVGKCFITTSKIFFVCFCLCNVYAPITLRLSLKFITPE